MEIRVDGEQKPWHVRVRWLSIRGSGYVWFCSPSFLSPWMHLDSGWFSPRFIIMNNMHGRCGPIFHHPEYVGDREVEAPPHDRIHSFLFSCIYFPFGCCEFLCPILEYNFCYHFELFACFQFNFLTIAIGLYLRFWIILNPLNTIVIHILSYVFNNIIVLHRSLHGFNTSSYRASLLTMHCEPFSQFRFSIFILIILSSYLFGLYVLLFCIDACPLHMVNIRYTSSYFYSYISPHESYPFILLLSYRFSLLCFYLWFQLVILCFGPLNGP
jgi:hypothetical protein